MFDEMLDVVALTKALTQELERLGDNDRMVAINHIRSRIHTVSPMKHHPIDLVLWVDAKTVEANDYNPNSVAKAEMQLLEISIEADGYTQPVVTWEDEGRRETIDGFHRGEVGRNSEIVRTSTNGLLPVTTIRGEVTDKNDRMASTIRHNRARGKHRVESMSEIVRDLARRNWNDKKIGRELGMEPDEVLRLKQISGLADLFADREFSQAWEPITEEE